MSCFDHIFIICPTFHDNETYNRPWLKKCKVFDASELIDTLDILTKRHSKGGPLAGKKSLIVIDDCSAEKDLNKHRSALSKIAFSGRHSNLTTWFVTQRYVSAPKDFRASTKWILIIKNICHDSFDQLMRENNVIPVKYRDEIERGLLKDFMLFVNTNEAEFIILNK
jgi:hypothetical protein